jgi:mono/diheme cytochrome c family protein
LKQDTPNLADASARLNRRWLFEWLLHPHKLRNGATMPGVLEATDKNKAAQQAADLVAFLVPQAAIARATTRSQKQIDRGEVLYEDLGCITCHKLTLPESNDEFARLSLAYVGEKYREGALAAFLRRPHATYRFSRMPDFRLNPDEASALAAFVRANGKGQLTDTHVPKGDGRRGASLFKSLGCNHCHSNRADGSREAPNQVALAAEAAARGCLGKTTDGRQAPRFEFNAAERGALAAFLRKGRESLSKTSPVEESARLVARLNCAACHRRDGQRTDRGLIIIEEGSRGLPPEVLPNLSWAGEKLWPEWTRALLAGELKEPARPWLKARMPRFPAYAAALSRGLAAEHGLDWRTARETHFKPKQAALGERLSLRNGGLDCRQCHGIGDLAPDGDRHTKNAPGINFALIKDRMRHDFYSRFVLDPPRFDIGVRMPKFSEDGRTTKVSGILGGDVRDQFEALWHYIQAVGEEPKGASPQSRGGLKPR